MSSESTFTVRRHFVSEAVREKGFDDYDEAKADYEHALTQGQVTGCELIDNRIGKPIREWSNSDPDPI